MENLIGRQLIIMTKVRNFRGELNNLYYQREYYGSASLLYAPFTEWAFTYAADYSFNNLSSNTSSGVKPYRHTVLQSLTARYQTRHLTITALMLGSLYMNGAKVGENAGNSRHLSPSVSLSWKRGSEKNFISVLLIKISFVLRLFRKLF